MIGGVNTIADAAASPVTKSSLWAPALDAQRKGPRIIASHQSPPLIEYLKIVNKKSHNLFADLTLKTIGRIVVGEGSYAAGSEVVRSFLSDEVKTDTAGVVIHDGSGLSGLSRVSAAVFVDVLKHMSQTALWDLYWETLPEAGNPRELRRMYRTPAAGNLRAKTGTIRRVSALSGLVRSANGERILFSILANDLRSTSRAKRVEDRIGVRLASFQRPFTTSAPAMVEPQMSVPRPVTATTHTVRSGENLSVIAPSLRGHPGRVDGGQPWPVAATPYAGNRAAIAYRGAGVRSDPPSEGRREFLGDCAHVRCVAERSDRG